MTEDAPLSAGNNPQDSPQDQQSGVHERLFEEADREAERHKWIESEKAGRDLGETAIRDWHRNYWRSWCRERWIEHLRGERFWVELDQDDYGLVERKFRGNLELAESVLERIKAGGENLDIIQWAAQENYNTDAVIEVLKALDINARRLASPGELYAADPPSGTEEDTPGRKCRILIVDDDDDTCSLLRQIFEQEDFECITTTSGEEAIRLTQQHHFDCYLIDIMLPGRHGAEVAWHLRRHRVTEPIIAISAMLERWNEDDLYDCGFTGIMRKPFELDELRDFAHYVIKQQSST